MTSPTLVSFHAHPDDEVLLTGGTLARLACEGRRVIVVFATDGAAGLAATAAVGPDGLAARRRSEATAAAAALGCEVRFLGYDDSGLDARAGQADVAFSRAPIESAARRLAEVLTEVRADAITVYDTAGGYGHPDHIAVHRVGLRAAQRAGIEQVFEATVDRRALLRLLHLLHLLRLSPPDWNPNKFLCAFTPPSQLTHRIDVRPFIHHKRTAMAAHVTQRTTDAGERTLERFLRLPDPVFRRVFGHEWFIERGHPPNGKLLTELIIGHHN